MKIVVLDGYTLNPGDLSWEKFKAIGDIVIYDRTPPELTLQRCYDADAVLTNKVVMDKKVISMLDNLKYIGVLATGYNVVDVEEARKRNIIVTNVPAYSTESVVQMTFAHILNITNRVAHYAKINRKGQWSKSPDFCYWNNTLHQLAGQTIGIVGLGNIGMRVASVALCFKMNVIALTSRRLSTIPEGIEKVTFDKLISTSNIITLHCPLNNNTQNMINREVLQKMKPQTILINTGRGPLVDENAVAEALESGKLLGYGTDVMCQEPPINNNPLLKAPNAFITPHIAWASFEARSRLMDVTFENLRAFILGRPMNVVN